jgi:hypothetical protein
VHFFQFFFGNWVLFDVTKNQIIPFWQRFYNFATRITRRQVIYFVHYVSLLIFFAKEIHLALKSTVFIKNFKMHQTFAISKTSRNDFEALHSSIIMSLMKFE